MAELQVNDVRLYYEEHGLGRSYGGEIAIDLTLRYPGRVRGLVLLEGAPLGLSAEGVAWAESVRQRVLAAAHDLTTVGEVFIRAVLGDSGWEAFPAPVRQLFTDNGPAIVAEVDGLLPFDRAALTTIDQPVLLIAAADSPEVFRHVTDATAAALPNSRRFNIAGGHLINPADPAVLRFLRDRTPLPGTWPGRCRPRCA